MTVSVTTTLSCPSPLEGEAGTRSVPGGGASSKKTSSSFHSFTPSQPSPLKGEGFRTLRAQPWQMSAHAHCAEISPMPNANSGMHSDVTRSASTFVDNILSANTSSISSALTASSSLKPMADNMRKNKPHMTQHAQHGLSNKAMTFSGFGTMTSSRTSKVLWTSSVKNFLPFPSPLEGEVGAPLRATGGGASSKKTSSFCGFTPSQPSPLKGEGLGRSAIAYSSSPPPLRGRVREGGTLP